MTDTIEEKLNLTPEEATEFRAIGVLLIDDPKRIDKIEDFYQHINPQHFFTERWELNKIYDVLRSLHNSGEPKDIIKIAAVMKSISAYDEKFITTLLKAAKENAFYMSDSLDVFSNQILERYVQSRIISLSNSGKPVDEVVKRLDDLVNEYGQSKSSLCINQSVEDKLNGVFQQNIENYASQTEISTGFIKFDSLLGVKHGLLPERLYVLGAVSSLGKTTFVHQMADNIAAQDIPVLFFSLEQSETELISKSIVREQYKIYGDPKTRKNGEVLATVGLLMKHGTKPKGTTEAIEKYRKTAKNVYIFEGNFNTTVETIAATVKRFKRMNRKSPVVFVDYLQLVKPSENDSKAKTKDVVDGVVNSLKILARDEKIPVVAISSFNRSYYNQSAAFNAYKESGSIEYSADTVLALQLQKLGEGVTDQIKLDEEKRSEIRKIQLVCLKNRGGQSTFSAYFDYIPKYEYFREREKDQ